MRSYEDISNRIMNRGDKLIESRKVRASKIKHTSYAISGMCAATIIGVSVWHIASSYNIKDNQFNSDNIISDTEKNTTTAITSANKSTTQSNSSVNITTENTKSSVPVYVTSHTATVTKSYVSHTETVIVPENNHSDTTAQVSAYLQITQQNTSTSLITTKIDSPTTTAPVQEISSEFLEIIIDDGIDPVTNNTIFRSYSYTKSVVSKELLENILCEKHISTEYFENNEQKKIETDIEIYSVKNISSNAAVAVKFKDKDGYYIYFDKSYYPASLQSLIDDLALSSDGINSTAYISNVKYHDFDTEKIWNMLTKNTDLPNDYNYCRNNGIVIVPKVSFFYTSPYISAIAGSMEVSEDGYLLTNIGRNGSYFYIGEDKANEMIEYIEK